MTASAFWRPARRWAVRIIAGGVLVTCLVAGGTAFRVWQYGRVDDRAKADVILVLGAAQYDGDPSEILENRLDQALSLYHEGVAAQIVTVGGGKPKDRYTEAEAGDRYLTDQGVPADRVTEVNTGGDTLTSLRAAAALFRRRGWQTAVLVSDPWHMLRSKTMAEDSGITAWTSPTHTGPAVRTRQTEALYVIRETAAMLYYRATRSPADDIGAGIG